MTSPLWTSAEAASAVGGKAVGEWSVDGLSIDTRSLKEGDLFVPLKDIRDGHEFIPQARTARAGAILSERPDEAVPALIVGDTLTALRALAVAARKRSTALRMAVTGSVGKTSVKELIAAICAAQGQTHKSLRSFNNHWGVPLTLATMPKDSKFGVFEMGMNHAGELADLSPLAEPQIAIITKIAPAHLAHFENIEAIARAKAEIFEGLVAGGTAILNADDHFFNFLSREAETRGGKILSFGEHKDADVRISEIYAAPGIVGGRMTFQSEEYPVELQLDGAHWMGNAACAFAASIAAGLDPLKAIESLRTFQALSGRGERLEVVVGGKSITLVDDSYNANPESMRASIAALAPVAGRKIAVLGDMFELGRDELNLHAALSAPLEAANVDRVITVGECMRALRGALPQKMRGAWAANWEVALDALAENVQDGDTVLVKGSNATGLSKLVAKLKQDKREAAHAL